MAKESGIGMVVNVDDSGSVSRAITNDVTNVSFSTPRAVQDITGLDKAAVERLLLLADFTCTLNGVFNDATNLSHAVFKTVSTTSVARATSFVHSGQTLTCGGAAGVVYTDYALTRGQDGSLGWSAPGSLANGTAPSWS